jgi:RHS repeat-associated protein
MKTNLNRKISNYYMLPGIKIYIFLTIAAALLSFKLQAQSPGYVQQDVIKMSGVINDAQINALQLGNIQTTRMFVDGLGRPIQTVALQASPVNNNDMVAPQAYNTLGQQTTGYLPYTDNSAINPVGSFRTTAIADQLSYYLNSGTTANPNKVANETTYPFSQQVFENSPLQRVLSAGMPGLPGGKSKSVTYRLNNNTQDGNILIWSLTGTYTSGNYYADNSLSVTDGKDEDGVETLAFADAAGHTVLKRQLLSGANIDTYYVYNAGGLISYIIPPLALAKMVSSGDYNPNDAPVSTLVFIFTYDNMGRLIEKTVPAKGKMSIVYDPFNRPVLMQDALMNSNHQWNYMRYDAKGRVVSQGIYTDTNSGRLTRSGMQSYVTGFTYANYYEVRNATQSSGYYSVRVFPAVNITPLAYAYFDDYRLGNSGTVFNYVSTTGLNEESATAAPVKGMPTMVRKATVGAALSGDWLLSATFYDKRLNPIQTRSNNQLYYSLDVLTDYKTTVPDFMGVPQTGYVKKVTSATTTTTVQTNLTYDYFYRVKTITQNYNSGAAVGIAAYTYNEMGQLVLKNLGQVSGSTYLQNLDMRYNIRGMLTNINNSKLASDTGKTNNDINDVFGMTLLYDQVDSKLSNTPYYNGKISAVKWMSRDGNNNSSYERAFKYYYDGMDRDTAAIYAERTTASTSAFTITHGWDENRITYDQNGNILTMFRDSSVQATGNHYPIDNLAYTYDPNNPNQLKTVTDGTTTAYKNSGFRNYTGSTGSYVYDSNGNLKTDPYKGLNISYNVLNRTDTVHLTWNATNRYITYTYDAGGNLIRKMQYDNGTLGTTTDYIDGFVFLTAGTGTPALSYLPMPEGRVLYSGGTFSQEYIITDQQGNARVSFNNTGAGGTVKVVQENSYYAFGLIMPGSTVPLPTTPNKKLYNGGSEWQNDYSNLPDYQQTFYRNYDAAIARWVAVDPVAESAESMTSYQYAGDNPVMKNDPMGDLIPYQYAGMSYSPSHANSVLGGGISDIDYTWSQMDANDAFVAGMNASLGGGGGDGGDGGGDGGGNDGDSNAGYSPSASGGSMASMYDGYQQPLTSRFHWQGGQTTQVDDGSNADYDVNPDGSLHFNGYTNQGGMNVENESTKFLFYTGYYDGIYGTVAGGVMTASSTSTKKANQGGGFNSGSNMDISQSSKESPGLSEEQLNALGTDLGILESMSKNAKYLAGAAKVAGHGLDAFNVIKGYKQDGNKFGNNTANAIRHVAASTAGATYGTYAGAIALGIVFAGNPAAIWVGGIIGGAVGGWLGDKAAEEFDQ